MRYEKKCNLYTNKKIPEAWKKAVQAEKMAELLTYHLIEQCLDTLSDVSIQLAADDKIVKVLKSWEKYREEFGKNAITVSDLGDSVLVECRYDIYAIRDDLQMMVTDLFGTLNPDNVSEDFLFKDIDIPKGEMKTLFSSVQKKIGAKKE